ncbi:MAG: substrate-binding domain-containing protein [Capsulimonadaceae bacterium]|nr:substrate-binding domain-containing protein [Capsulimonadaceae bacterium]
MIETPSTRILDDLAASYHDGSPVPLHEIVRSGLGEIIDRHFVDGQKFWPETTLAERLNVSRMTVRRALNDLSDQGRISRQRARGTFVRKGAKQRMRDAAPKTAYKSVGIFVPYLGSPFWSEMIDEIANVASAEGRTLHVYTCDRGEPGASAAAQLATSPSDEAMLLLGNTHAATVDLYAALTGRGYRVVTIDTPIRGFPVPFVGVDNDMGIHMAVSHLIDLGHTRITLFNWEPPSYIITQNRINAFLSIAQERSLHDARVFRVNHAHPGGAHRVISAAMEQIWGDAGNRPTAILYDSEGSAPAALKWCAGQGVRVPDDLSILCFDDAREIQFARPPLTCIAQPLARIARRVMALVSHPANEHVLLPPTLIVRASTAPPSAIPYVNRGELQVSPVKRSPKSSAKRNAFTLIELLVVIAIIAILAAILFPVFATAREKARQSACMNNMKQIGLALVQYTQDYDEYFPCGATVASQAGRGWAGELYPYVKSTGAFFCPDDQTVQTPPSNPLSYGFNLEIMRNLGASPFATHAHQQSEFTAPALTVALSEVTGGQFLTSASENYSCGSNGEDTYSIDGKCAPANGPFPNGNSSTARHNNGQGSNYAYCDGHVKYLNSGQVSIGWTIVTSTCYSGVCDWGFNGAAYPQWASGADIMGVRNASNGALSPHIYSATYSIR